MNFRKHILSLVILSILGLACINATDGFVLDEGASATLYNSNFEVIDAQTAINDDGYIIVTQDQSVVLNSDFATITLAPSSIFSITNYDAAKPEAYLIKGQANIYLLYPFDKAITIYTPVTCFDIKNAGEYVVISTDNEETVLNFSEEDITLFDNIRKSEATLNTYKQIDLISNAQKDVNEATYSKYSIFSTFSGETPVILETVPGVVNSEIKVEVVAENEVPLTPSIASFTEVKNEVPNTPWLLVETDKTPESPWLIVDTNKVPESPWLLTTTKQLPTDNTFKVTTTTPVVDQAPLQPKMSIKTTQFMSIPKAPSFKDVKVTKEEAKIIPIKAPTVRAIYEGEDFIPQRVASLTVKSIQTSKELEVEKKS